MSLKRKWGGMWLYTWVLWIGAFGLTGCTSCEMTCWLRGELIDWFTAWIVWIENKYVFKMYKMVYLPPK